MKKIVLLYLLCISLSACSSDIGQTEDESATTEEPSIPETETISENLSSYDEGQELSESLIDDMESINWDENYDKASEMGEDLANYLNQFLAGGDN